MSGFGEGYFHGLPSPMEPATGAFSGSSSFGMGSSSSSFTPYQSSSPLSPTLPYHSSISMGSYSSTSSYMNPYLQMHGLGKDF